MVSNVLGALMLMADESLQIGFSVCRYVIVVLVYPITINWRLRWVEKYRAGHHHLNDLAGTLRKVHLLLCLKEL